MKTQELPSFLQGNPWVDILSKRGTEPEPVAVSTPPIESQPSVHIQAPQPYPPTDTVAGEVLKEVRQLLQSFKIQTNVQSQPTVIVIPIYIPFPGFYPATHMAGPEPAKASKQVLCPKCGRYGTLHVHQKTKNNKTYVYADVYHGKGDICYIGPVPKVGNFRELGNPTEKASNQATFQKSMRARRSAWTRTPACGAGDRGFKSHRAH